MSEKDFYLYVDGKPVKVSKDVYRECKHSEDKERYFMKRLKKGRFVIDAEAQTVTYIPSREESYERLLDADWQLPASGEAVEDIAVKAVLLEQLRSALHMLTHEEMVLIQELFYLEKTEREVCAALNVAKTTLHDRKNRILLKLREQLEK